MELTTGLTVAWLDAVRRAQSDTAQRLQAQLPQAAASYEDRTLTDVIERAVESGGAEPPPESRVPTDGRGKLVDVRV
ncbi:hypothetical protein A33M_3776 [Rhodovulum sp. PH10]|uniref:hypothetical protein n=1 Tax=Rhodovulum sp. PH10 TaxID=1187851 RepID=UPI00027C245D|nr:hypothetical protein [Rhodovulum sp. PH10]EJW13356.1 hypothetical protein A33M_3776 [Rhodovulum sp. PH10]